jgi:hypothetical protein
MSADELLNISESPESGNGTRSASATWRRPGQWTILGFRFVPLLLFAAGTCGVIYGAFYHRIPVVEKRVEKYTVQVLDKQAPPPIPPELKMPEVPGWGPPGIGPDSIPFPAPPKMKDEERTRTRIIETEESELSVNEAVTVDGIEFLADGRLAWVARGDNGGGGGGTKGPAACPT